MITVVYDGFHNEVPASRQLKQQKFIVSQFWRLTGGFF